MIVIVALISAGWRRIRASRPCFGPASCLMIDNMTQRPTGESMVSWRGGDT
jgi:hypothetical protein